MQHVKIVAKDVSSNVLTRTKCSDTFDSLALTLNDIETRLSTIIPSAQTWPVKLHQAQRHALLAPGKRFRPLLCCLVAEGGGLKSPSVVDVGCVSEMVHTASLVLDDLPCMDDANLRRGRPTTHIAFNESTAILTATALLNRAFGVLVRLKDVAPHKRIELVDLLSYYVGSHGLIAGQVADLSNTDNHASIVEVERVNTLKTGALFDFSVESAAILVGMSGSQRAALKDFTHHLGLAFQLLDDMKDTLMSEGQSQKSTQRDIGKATIVALTGCAASMARLTDYIDAAKDALTYAELENTAMLHRVLDKQFAFIPQ